MSFENCKAHAKYDLNHENSCLQLLERTCLIMDLDNIFYRKVISFFKT